MNKSKILISFVLAISLFLITSISLVKPSYAASCVVSWSVSNKSPAANTEINVSVTQQPGQSSGVNWTNVHLYLDNTQDGLTFVNFDSGSRTSNYKANSRSAGSHTLRFTTDGNVTDSNGTTGVRCTPQESFTTSGSGNSSTSKIYIDPNPMEPGQSVILTATSAESCSYDLSGSEGTGLTNCESGGGGTCDKNKPHNISGDSNPCWWRWKCTAGSTEGEYKATFDIKNPPSSGACYAEKTYKIAKKEPEATTKCYRIVENKADFKTAECKEYKGAGMEIDYDFKTPGQKFIFVEFEDSKGNKGGCGEKKDQPCQAEIKVLGSNPVITSCSLSFEGNNTILNLTADKDKGFGSDKGKVKSGDKELGIKKWKNDNVQVIWTDSSTGEKIPVVLTNSDGQDSEEVQCSAVSQLSLGAKVFCRAPSSHDTDNVDLVLAEAFEGGKKNKQKVKIDKDGVVIGLSQKLEEGRKYKVSLKAPKSLRKTAGFTAGSGTTNVPNFTLPVGDIFPVDGGDGTINSADKAELNRQWIIASDATNRSGDFNEDGRVNSIDWACMIHDYGSSDDKEPEAGGPPVSSPSPSQNSDSASSSSFRVFVTSSAYNGNLGGLASGDTKCQERANSANLGGVWKAWLSGSNTSAASRLYHSNTPYKLLDNKMVANNWDDLVDVSSGSDLRNPINISENNSLMSGKDVWTGSGPDGLSNSRTNCNNWADSTTGVSGAVGSSSEVNRVKWTYNSGAFDCSSTAHLYCFEQPTYTYNR